MRCFEQPSRHESSESPVARNLRFSQPTEMLPIRDEPKTALFERKKRTPLTAVGSSGTFRACCGAGAGSSNTFRAFCGSRAGSSGTFRAVRSSGAGSRSTFRAVCGSGPGLSSTFRAFCGSGASSSGHWLRARLERPFRASCGPGAGFDDSCGVSSSRVGDESSSSVQAS